MWIFKRIRINKPTAKRITTKESDEYCQELIERSNNGFTVLAIPKGYGNGIGEVGNMTSYSLFAPNGKEGLYDYIDTDNNGVIDYVRKKNNK